MRLVVSFAVLLVILMAVLFSAKKQVETLKPPAGAASAASAVPLPQAVGRQVQHAISEGARRASEAQP
jgi:hypothetical protein